MNNDLIAILNEAAGNGQIKSSTLENIREMIDGSSDSRYEAVISELAQGEYWTELDDRFFRKLAFGTGGLRGRTIGEIVTPSEMGEATEGDRPDYPCVGTNALNNYNITRATLGLVRHLLAQNEGGERPSIALARDTRHYGKEFAECVCKVATENGVDVHLFTNPRSTPQLSFAVRHLGATAGIVLTASHNPAHDNGYKVYGKDGAQIVEPDASQIIAQVNAIAGESFEPVEESARGTIHEIGEELDEPYLQRLESLLLDPELVKSQSNLKIVFTNLHGTGGVISPQLLRRLGFHCDTVEEQDKQDGWFPTVKSPNPENAAALEMAIAQAERSDADLVIGTDPDCDRMAVAVRNASGQMTLLTGNQIGSLMGYYRVKTLTEQGILNDSTRGNAVLVKTLVTTELQTAIAQSFGINTVNTLTGFKYIGAKLRKYENQIPEDLRTDYRNLSDEETRRLRLEHSRYFVFGGEESYGYLGADFLRDKDGNGAVAMFAEVCAYATSQGITPVELLDRIFCEHGIFLEGQHAEKLEGSDGAEKIQKLAKSYSENPPTEVDGVAVSQVRDFANADFTDEEGDPIPKEKMVFVDMTDGRAFAVRPSGTEPKIKFYIYVKPDGEGIPLEASQLAGAKQSAEASFESLKSWIINDMHSRLGVK